MSKRESAGNGGGLRVKVEELRGEAGRSEYILRKIALVIAEISKGSSNLVTS